MNFFCGDCTIHARQPFNHRDAIKQKCQPLKLKLLSSLGLMHPIINKFVISKDRRKYTFPRHHLRFLETTRCSIPLIHFSRNNPQKSTVLIYSHGNSSNLNNIYGFARKMYEIYGLAVVAYDYSGYGESRRTEINFEQDIKTVLAWVIDQGYPIDRVILGGFSLGTYSTLLLEGIMSRLLIAPITGLTAFIEGEVAHYENEPFDNISAAKRLKSRVFMVHSIDDDITIEHSRALYKAMVQDKDTSEQSKINYVQTAQLKHEQMVEFFGNLAINPVREQNKEFMRFVNQIRKDVTPKETPIACKATLQLLEELKQLRGVTIVYEDVNSSKL